MRSHVLFSSALFFKITRCLPAIIVAGLNVGCKEESPPQPPPPPPYVSSVQLTLEDTGLTDVWLKLGFTDTTQPRAYQVRRDGATILSGTLITPDTVLLDTTALPRRTYHYKAYRVNGTTLKDSSANLSVTTLDTTGHSFTWQVDTLGVTSSVLYDVAIINDTLAYAVGEMYLRDSTGQIDPTFYNIAKWNGQLWTLARVYYQGTNLLHPTWILAFSAQDIWITPVTHWDGIRFHDVIFDPIFSGIRTNRAWGTSSRDFYVVGNGGFVAHYNGSMWQRVESGTTLPIADVYGARNAQTRKNEILCVAEAYGVPGASKLLSIEGTIIREVRTNGLDSWGVEGIWFAPLRHYVVVGQGVWRARAAEGQWRYEETLPPVATTSISGQRINDIVVGGAFWLLAHWNGARWQTYFPRTSGSFTAVQIKNNLIMAVGGIGNKAVVARGKR